MASSDLVLTPPVPTRGVVLVIDDEPALREMLALDLSLEGYVVDTVGSGEAAVAKVQARAFDLVVTDLMMPGLDGLGTVTALKQLCPDVEIVVATGHASVESAVACMKAGAFDYIRKPYNLDELRLTLERALHKSRLEGLAALYGATRRLLGLLRLSDIVAVVPEVARQVVRAEEVTFVLDELPATGQPARVERESLVCRAEPKEAPGGTVTFKRSPGSAAFSNADVRRCELLMPLVAVALEKAELYRRLEQLVATDELTGLYSRRFFLGALQQQIRMSSRTGLPVSCLVADIDFFKRVNDTQGHAGGDRVLVEIGRQIREVFRQSDVAARLGGEEFAILLPATSIADACVAAERLRRTIEAGGSGVTLSVGVSGLPGGSFVEDAEVGSVATAIVECADTALYGAKAGGRNQVASRPMKMKEVCA